MTLDQGLELMLGLPPRRSLEDTLLFLDGDEIAPAQKRQTPTQSLESSFGFPHPLAI